MRFIILIISLAGLALSQTASPYPIIGVQWYQPLGYVPSSTTAVTASTSILNYIWLNNTSGSAVTVTFTDASTVCSSGTCQILGISIAANSVISGPVGGLIAVNGVKWSASTGSAVVGYMTGNYIANLTAEVWPYRDDSLLVFGLGE